MRIRKTQTQEQTEHQRSQIGTFGASLHDHWKPNRTDWTRKPIWFYAGSQCEPAVWKDTIRQLNQSFIAYYHLQDLDKNNQLLITCML